MVESGMDGPKNQCNWKGLPARKAEAFGGYLDCASGTRKNVDVGRGLV